MEFEDLIKRLNKFGKAVNNAIIGLTIFEAVIVILIGVVSNKISNEFNIYSFSLFFLIIVYVLVLLIRTIYDVSFPSSIVSELHSERQLSQLKHNAERESTINGFFIETMQKLNSQTCALANTNNEKNLCAKGIREGIKDLIEPIIKNTNFLLDTPKRDFLIGLYLGEYLSLNKGSIKTESGMIILSNSLFGSDPIHKDLLESTDLQGEQLLIQMAIRESLNNHEFVKKNIKANDGKELSIFCSPVPSACYENDTLGVFYIIGMKIDNDPKDLSMKLTIFNRVISNWIFRYNDCVYNKQ